MRKAITDEGLIHLLGEYSFDHPGKKIKIPEFGKYIREKGFDVEDYTIRRNDKCKKYIDSLNNKAHENVKNELVTYKTIDADAFINANKSRSDLKKALIERDSYYSRIANHAVIVLNEKKELEQQIEALKKKNEDLQSKLEKVKANANNDREQEKTIAKLKKLLNEYVYPDIANILLAEEGVIGPKDPSYRNTIVSKDKIHVISADTVIKPEDEDIPEETIKPSEFGTINRLSGGFGKR